MGFESSPKFSTSCLSILHQVVSSHHKQIDVLRHISAKKRTYWGYNVCQSRWNEGGQINAKSYAYEGDL